MSFKFGSRLISPRSSVETAAVIDFSPLSSPPFLVQELVPKNFENRKEYFLGNECCGVRLYRLQFWDG